MMTHAFRGLMATLCFSVFAPAALADRCPVRFAAEQYRECVKDFERCVYRCDLMGRDQRRVADALEDQTSRVLDRAKRLRDWNRLEFEVQKADFLQRQVEAIVFANPYFPGSEKLIASWQKVLAAQSVLLQAMETYHGPLGISCGNAGALNPAFGVNPGITFQLRPSIGVNVPRYPAGFGGAGLNGVYGNRAGIGVPFGYGVQSGFGVPSGFGVQGLNSGFRRVPSRSLQGFPATNLGVPSRSGSCAPNSGFSRRSVGGISIGAFLQR